MGITSIATFGSLTLQLAEYSHLALFPTIPITMACPSFYHRGTGCANTGIHNKEVGVYSYLLTVRRYTYTRREDWVGVQSHSPGSETIFLYSSLGRAGSQ
ncbi:hypothetical protein AMATHDRAFT_60337 [Amanita thiersii Skay4041]|uniref:Uncharacterized protein n=1 Tax=Amanita thiersii Skay4041 TaxID=703135 RepID=A0A2A9NSU5_9AGAR|nr:hypothetical protein AMATHDRAFT_60337 [Amanita thiersii Skay4041]